MCLPPANARIWPNPLLYSAVYHRYSLKSFQLCKSAQTYWYRKYFEHSVARSQGDSSCLTIDNIKPELCPNSAPLYNPMSVVDNSAPLFFTRQHTICLGTRLCTYAVYLRENIQHPLSRLTHFAHAGLARNVLKNWSAAFPRVVKCCILYILFIFSFSTLDEGLNLL